MKFTLILLMLMAASDTFSIAEGKNNVTVRRTAVYRDTVTNTRLAEMVFPNSTYMRNVTNRMILLATKNEAMFSPRRYELLMIFEISFLKETQHKLFAMFQAMKSKAVFHVVSLYFIARINLEKLIVKELKRQIACRRTDKTERTVCWLCCVKYFLQGRG